MILRFTWRPEEWREACVLSAAPRQRRTGGSVGMGYFVVGVMAVGGIGDLVHTVRSSHVRLLHGTLLPVLLGTAASLAAAAAVLYWVRRLRQWRGMPATPAGEQQLVLHELGWKATSEAAEDAPVQAWSELRGQRTGRRVLTLLTRDGSTVGVPLRVITHDQGGWIERILSRKIPREA